MYDDSPTRERITRPVHNARIRLAERRPDKALRNSRRMPARVKVAI